MFLIPDSNLRGIAYSIRKAVFAAAGLVILCGIAAADPIHVSEAEAKAAAVSKSIPAVPPIAKQAHITGRVLIDLTVAEDGSVEKVDVVSGNPILAGAATKAGKGWSFKPFKGPDGAPTKAVVRLGFEF